MSKWRPTTKNCLYVIPDVHGSINLLKKVCDRILPLRKSDGGKDRIVFLGDYIDRSVDSPKVVDLCIELKKKYGDQIEFLMGNHEYMLLQSLDCVPGRSMSIQTKYHTHRMWMANGGDQTILGYIRRQNGDEDGWGSVPLSRIADFIPKNHIEFFQSLKKYYETDDYIFVHGGMNPYHKISNHDMEDVIWDRSLVKTVVTSIQMRNKLTPWEKTIVCGHSVQSDGKPIIAEKFMMLDVGAPKQLLIVEMNSMEAFMAYPDKDRMVKYELKETVSLPGVVRRSQTP